VFGTNFNRHESISRKCDLFHLNHTKDKLEINKQYMYIPLTGPPLIRGCWSVEMIVCTGECSKKKDKQ
jgi:hypothetical protein